MKKDFYRVIGVMSGTSLDGIDLLLCEFHRNPKGQWTYTLGPSDTKSYPEEWKQRLSEGVHLAPAELEPLNKDYTDYLAMVISDFINQKGLTDLDAVCSHGHTILHQPENGYTLQIGNLPSIAHVIGLPVVCDFRVQDVALGGQGAPLVPIGDRLLFHEYDACVNLGGFANISFEGEQGRLAYDICPVNVVLNALANELGYDFDDGGRLAASGSLDKELLEALNALGYYQEAPPKSLGMEWVNKEIFPMLKASPLSVSDLLNTFTEHIARQLAKSVPASGKVLLTGGGAYNSFLLQRVRELSSADWVVPEPQLVEFKEALIFALLGVLRLRDEVNCLATVTGASHDHSSGSIFFP